MKKYKSSNNVFEFLKREKDDIVSVAVGKKGHQLSKIIERAEKNFENKNLLKIPGNDAIEKKSINPDEKTKGPLVFNKFENLKFKKPIIKIQSSAHLNYPYYHKY